MNSASQSPKKNSPHPTHYNSQQRTSSEAKITPVDYEKIEGNSPLIKTDHASKIMEMHVCHSESTQTQDNIVKQLEDLKDKLSSDRLIVIYLSSFQINYRKCNPKRNAS